MALYIGGVAVDATAAEIDVLDGLDRGSIIYGNASSATTVLGQGDADEVLTSDGTDIAWAAGGASDIDGLSDAISEGAEFTNSLLLGDATTGVLDNAHSTTAVGIDTINSLTSGSQNTFIGFNSGTACTTGYINTCIGKNSGYTITTGAANVMLGAGNTTTNGTEDCSILIGYALTMGETNTTHIGRGGAGNQITNDFMSNATWSHTSDLRMKRNIQDDILGLSFINDLKTRTFQWKPSEELPEEWEDWTYAKDEDGNDTEERIYAPTHDKVMHGMIAQEVKTALDTAGIDTFGGWSENVKGVQSLGATDFIYPLIKAVQELSAKVEALENA